MKEVPTTFVLGAGFSVDQGFPLARDLRARVVHFLEAERHPSYETFLVPDDVFSHGQFYDGLAQLDPTRQLGFEELLIELRKLCQQGDDSLTPLDVTLRIGAVRLLWCVTHGNRHPEQTYLRFARLVGAAESYVVTLNWDLLVETCLTAIGAPWRYAIADGHTSIIKPHGSVNWTSIAQRPELSSRYRDWVPVAPSSTMSYDCADPLGNPFEQEINSDLRYCLFPGDPETHQDVHLLWRDVRTAVQRSDKVVFIGYSMPEYDRYAIRTFAEMCTGKLIEVWDPSSETRMRYQALFPDAELTEARFAQVPYVL